MNLKKVEIIVAGIVLAAIIFFHFTLYHSGGPIWGDKINSVHLARMSLTKGINSALSYDSFPPLSIVIFHFWNIFFQSDQGFRFFGLIIGLGVIATIWFNAKIFKSGMPVLVLAIFGLNSVAIRFGDATRAYGLGTIFVILTFGLVWKLTLDNFNLKNFFLATTAAILSVQTMYQNAFLVLSICLGGILVLIVRKDWKKIWSICAVGLIAALSLIPYISFIKNANDWSIVAQAQQHQDSIWPVISQAFGIPSLPGISAILIVISFLALIFFSLRSQETVQQKEKILFIIISLFIGALLFITFLVRIRVPVKDYYLIPIIALTAIVLEIIIESKKVRILLALLLLIISFPKVFTDLKTRVTDIDLIAEQIAENANTNDYILINPWQVGVSFNHYYMGANKWQTLPPMEDLSIFRYDLIKEKLSQPDPTKEVFDQIEKTLSSGNKVWVVGYIETLPGETVTKDKPTGNFMNPYLEYWTVQLNQFLKDHKVNQQPVALDYSKSIHDYENFPLTVLSNWQ